MDYVMIDKSIAEHYKWGQNCDGWHLVKSESLSIIQESMPPKTFERRHKHLRSRQFFYILSGEATIEVDGQRNVFKSEQGLEVLPDKEHQVLNESNSDLNFLVISYPPSHSDRVDA
jgi:mannose-6-phosphate isomerase-like protein (cupin superfamily)